MALISACFIRTSESQTITLKNAVPDGIARIHLSEASDQNLIMTNVVETGKTEAPMVVINEANHEQLMALPGIGSKTASLIISERNQRLFSDWRDLQDRVKGLGDTKTANFRELGVRLNR